jgi:hypothetical protein
MVLPSATRRRQPLMTDTRIPRELSRDELNTLNGGNILQDIVRALGTVIRILSGSGPITGK